MGQLANKVDRKAWMEWLRPLFPGVDLSLVQLIEIKARIGHKVIVLIERRGQKWAEVADAGKLEDWLSWLNDNGIILPNEEATTARLIIPVDDLVMVNVERYLSMPAPWTLRPPESDDRGTQDGQRES